MISVASFRKGLKSLSLVGFTVITVVSVAIAAVPGFPFTEDFTSNALEDPATTADWDTTAPGTLRLGFATELTGMTFVRTPLGDSGEVATYSRDVALADIDGDGDLDAVVGNHGLNSTGQTNSAYLNNNGAFDLAPVAVGTDSRRTFGIAVGDLDRDGDQDVVAGNFQQRNAYYLNDGAGNFTPGADVASRAGNTWRVHLVDVDGDADLDIIESMSDNSNNYLYVNQLVENGGVLSFSESVRITSESFNTRSLALGDVDNDGDMDFVAGDQNTKNHAYRWFDGSFRARGETLPPDANTTFSVALADVDGDGWLDLIEGNSGAATQIYLNQGAGNPGFFNAPVALADSNALHTTVSLITRDVDRDGDIDIFEGNNGAWDHDGDAGAGETCLAPGASTPCIGQPARLFLNNGNGTFAAGIDFQPPQVQKIYGSAAGDIDGDGLLDFVTAHSTNNPGGPVATSSNAVYINGGTPSANSVRQLDSMAISLEVDGGNTAIPAARLSVGTTQPAALANLDFFLSNDGGTTFIPATPGVPVAFPNSNGNALVWKVDMLTATPNVTYAEVVQISIAGNGPPNFTNIGNINAVEGQGLTATSLSLYFSDPNGDALTYQLSGLPAGTGLSLNSSTGQISGVLTNDDALASPITLSATAFDGASATAGNITLNVLDAVNDPPTALDDGPYMLDEGGAIASTFNVLDNDSDPEFQPLNAVLVDAPLNSALFELNPLGTFDYTHDGSETTTDSFTYRADDGGSQSAVATVSLAINPVNDAPVIAVTGSATVNIKVGDAFTDAGASATDAEDGDISANIVVGGDVVDTNTAGTYVITYDVSDSAAAPAVQATRTVNVATNNPPVITLTGNAAITLTTGDAYTDAGATAVDDEDGDITANIVVGGAVNTAAAGVYTLTYNVMDMDGNAAAEVTRTVTVNDPPPPPPPPKKKKGGGATGLLEFFGLGFAGLVMFRRRRARKLLA